MDFLDIAAGGSEDAYFGSDVDQEVISEGIVADNAEVVIRAINDINDIMDDRKTSFLSG